MQDINETEFLKNIGENLTNIRKKKKITARAIKIATGISDNTITNIEKSKFVPRIDTLYRIAKFLEVDVMEFFRDNSNSEIDTYTVEILQKLVVKLRKMDIHDVNIFLNNN